MRFLESALPLAVLATSLALVPIAPSAVAQRPGVATLDVDYGDAPTISVEFAGGTASQYIAVLRDALPGVNIVERGPVARVPVNPVSIHGADPYAAVLLLDEIEAIHSGEEFHVQVEQISTRGDRAPIYVVTAISRATNRLPPAVSQVMSLQEIVTLEVQVDHALSAIEAALALAPGEQAPSIRYHEDTALLIVRAHPDQVETVQQVLQQLVRGAQVSLRTRDRAQQSRRTQKRVQELDLAVAELRAQADAMGADRTEWQTRAEMYLKQTEDLRIALAEARSEASALTRRVQQLERELSRRDAAGGGVGGGGGR